MYPAAMEPELQSDRQSPDSKKKGARDADVLLLVWDAFKTRANEIDTLLDLSLSLLATASDFPQKAELQSSVKKALVLLREFP